MTERYTWRDPIEIIGDRALAVMRPISISEVASEKIKAGGVLDLYLHIPFCDRICDYCAFHVKALQPGEMEKYIGVLKRHITKTLSPFSENQQVGSIFVGGGTPGLLKLDETKAIFDAISGLVSVKNVPVSYELHPGNISDRYVDGLRGLGVTRFSVGIQNLSDKERKGIGRDITSSDDDINGLCVLNRHNVQYNVDLMFGTPGQTPESWRGTLTKMTVEVRPPEITLYPFVDSPGALMYKPISRGVVTPPTKKERRNMYNLAGDYLTKVGYKQTSVLSFALDAGNKRALLNSGTDFLGLGPRTYSGIGGYLFINQVRISDFLRGEKDANFKGIKIPSLVLNSVQEIFKLIAGKENQQSMNAINRTLGIMKAEGVAQTYKLLYYLMNNTSSSL